MLDDSGAGSDEGSFPSHLSSRLDPNASSGGDGETLPILRPPPPALHWNRTRRTHPSHPCETGEAQQPFRPLTLRRHASLLSPPPRTFLPSPPPSSDYTPHPPAPPSSVQERLLRLLSRHDLSRRDGLSAHEVAHVSNASEKHTLRAMLLEQPFSFSHALEEMRSSLGYGKAQGEPLSWERATLSEP